MLYLPDANILIYAKMAGMPEHKAALKWLNAALSDKNTTLLVSETTILAFLRITTNKKVFSPPLSVGDARKFVKALLSDSSVQLFRPTPDHFAAVADLMKKQKFIGNLTMDAHIAAIAISAGATVVTYDADFKKIPYLKVIEPS